MATLPDGTTVNLQHEEGWETNPPAHALEHDEPWEVVLPAPQQVWDEAWETVLIVMAEMTIGADAPTIAAGEPASLSGVSRGDDGNPYDADLHHVDPTGTDVVEAVVRGDYTETLQLNQAGDHDFFIQNDRVGIQHDEPWDVVLPTPPLVHDEGWEA